MSRPKLLQEIVEALVSDADYGAYVTESDYYYWVNGTSIHLLEQSTGDHYRITTTITKIPKEDTA